MTERPLRVALVGLGDIAAKAYLPVLAADPGVRPVLVTRDPRRRAALQAAWRIPDAFPSMEYALAAGPPPDADARAIVESARAAGVSLAVLFNRRFAPAYAELATWDDLDTVVLTKNRDAQPDEPRWFVVDDFVHVVDTLRFLVGPAAELVDVSTRRCADGRLGRLAIVVREAGRIGIGIMDRDGGQTVEVLEAMAPGRSRQVTDLVDVVERRDGAAHHRQPDNWASVPAQRGFVAMVTAMLAAVRAGEVLDGADALATHAMCEEIVLRAEGRAG